jgi:hypothetical protein
MKNMPATKLGAEAREAQEAMYTEISKLSANLPPAKIVELKEKFGFAMMAAFRYGLVSGGGKIHRA